MIPTGDQLHIQRTAGVIRSDLNIQEEQKSSRRSSTSAPANKKTQSHIETEKSESRESGESFNQKDGTDSTRQMSSHRTSTTTSISLGISKNEYDEEMSMKNDSADRKSALHDITQQVPTLSEEQKIINIDDVKKAIVLSRELQDITTYVSYWDCGGDDVYHGTHHIHLSPDAVYILAFDMTSMIKDDGKYLTSYLDQRHVIVFLYMREKT